MAMEDHGKRFSMVVKTFHHKTIYPSKMITIFWGDEGFE
jgi:hypothetical protein